MSTVFINVGQCGNQVGAQFLDSLCDDKNGAFSGLLKGTDGKLQSIHVDSESKVIKKILSSDLSRSLKRDAIICGKRGCGSNWGCGYHRRDLLDQTLEVMRTEVERCDVYSGCLIVHSLCGGTGSGLSSRLVEALRDEYPLQHIMNIAIAPHWTGESPLQQYNSLLCLACLQQNSDAIMVFNNDIIFHTLEEASGQSARGEDRGFSNQELNSLIISCISGCFLPVNGQVTFGNQPWELFQSCCPMPDLKFLTVCQQVSQRPHTSWLEISQSLTRKVAGSCSGQIPRTVSALAVARGHTGHAFHSNFDKISSRLKSDLGCSHWNPFPLDFWVERYGNKAKRKSLTVVLNSDVMAKYISRVSEEARRKFLVKAYMHWYVQYGCEENDFEQAFHTLRKVVDNYEYFTTPNLQ